ncbi:MAG: hypothetical protein CVV44_15980 [Spirochaetae bacterium HGW-Spirochaetae-1]|jgi:peptidyl-prolyl cis-trans isomerase C|nr:MAG: hypothetical protein CVV44_15980 [Spirochaetae bacterium HGW-Spirochaetae-1]
MRRYVWLILAAVIFMTAGCKRDSDVLATYNEGKITRGEFYQWLEARHLSKEMILQTKAKQEAKLKQIALDRLTVKEAAKAGYDKSEDFAKLLGLVKNNFIAGFYRKNMKNDLSFKEEAIKANIIKLRVKDYKIVNNKREKLSEAEQEKAFQERIAEAKNIIAELEKGGKFDELAKKYSDDYSKKKGGDIGFITKGMRDMEFSDAAFAMKEGEYTKEPLRVRNALYIIKVDKKKELTSDNIEDIIDDENQAKRLKNRLQADSSRDFEKKLKESKDIVNNIEKANYRNPKDVLYKVGNEEFTVAGLNDLLSFIEKKRGDMGKKDMDFDVEKKKRLAERMLDEKLMLREALKKGIDKDEKFIQEWQSFKEFTLANAYINDVLLAGITVTPQEVKAEYDKNRQREIERNKRAPGNKKEAPKSFGEMKERIEYMIYSRKRSEKKRDYEKNLLDQNGFKIDDSELEEAKKKDKK